MTLSAMTFQVRDQCLRSRIATESNAPLAAKKHNVRRNDSRTGHGNRASEREGVVTYYNVGTRYVASYGRREYL